MLAKYNHTLIPQGKHTYINPFMPNNLPCKIPLWQLAHNFLQWLAYTGKRPPVNAGSVTQIYCSKKPSGYTFIAVYKRTTVTVSIIYNRMLIYATNVIYGMYW